MRLAGIHIKNWYEFFSLRILLKTLFHPWRQIVNRPVRDSSLKARFDSMVDNLVSRVVGFMVRIMTIIAGGIVIVLVVVASVFWFIMWPLLPLAPAILVFIGGLL